MADVEENSRMRKFHPFLSCVMKNLLVILLIVGVFLGVCIGIGLRTLNMSPNSKQYMGYLGDILIQALKSVAVPVMLGAIISNIGILDVKTSGKISLHIVVYLLLSKSCAAILSIPLCLLVRPGATDQNLPVNETIHGYFPKDTSQRAIDKFLNIGRNILPENWMEMFLSHYETEIVNATKPYHTDYVVVMKQGPNLLGIVVVSFLVGAALSRMKEEGTPLTTMFDCVTKVSMIVTKWFIWIAPIGVLFIICREILKADNIVENLITLGKFLAVLWSCCIIQLLVIHPAIYFLSTRKNPYKIFMHCKESIVIALATASSYGTMPIAIKELIENLKVNERVVNVVIPIGITINKDGAFYMYVIGSLFEAQRTHRPMGLDLILIVLILALTTSMATAAVPYEGMILLIMMWSTLNLKNTEKDVGLLLMVDFLGDRIRTLLNVYGNIFCAAVLDHFNLFEDDASLP